MHAPPNAVAPLKPPAKTSGGNVTLILPKETDLNKFPRLRGLTLEGKQTRQ